MHSIVIRVHEDVLVSLYLILSRCSVWMEKPQGWASLTRLHNPVTAASLHEDPFPSLRGAGDNSAGRHRAIAAAGASSLQAPFVSVVSKGLVNASASGEAGGIETSLTPEDLVVTRLREQHGWADDVLLRDVLRAVDGDEGMACQQLDAMAGPESPGAGEKDGDGIRPAGAVECEENDVYLKFRREALRLSRYVRAGVEWSHWSVCR